MSLFSFSDRLRSLFEARKARNRRYSVRAFAAALDADPGTLAQILRGARAPTVAQIKDWSRRLALSEVETMAYLATRLHETPEQAAKTAVVAHSAAEALSIAREPMHYLMLAYVAAQQALPMLPEFAATHGRTVDAAQMALTRLLRLGWIVQTTPEAFRDATGIGHLPIAAFHRFLADQHESVFDPIPKKTGDSE
jgi:transcriptional regulator with XRE-family HTH domain